MSQGYPSERTSTDILVEYDAHLWGLVIAFFGVGDLATTIVGLSARRVVESGPLAAPVVAQFGVAGMLGLKAAVMVLFYVLWRVVSEPENVGVPLGLAALGILVTGWNCWILLQIYG